MARGNRGSISLLFMAFLLPVFALLLGLAIETSQFFGLRERVQDLIDREVQLGLRRAHGVTETERRIRERIHSSFEHLRIGDVSVSSDGATSHVEIQGLYSGLFTRVFGDLGAGGVMNVPFRLQTVARRARTTALIVVDRGVEGGQALCDDESLNARTSLAARLSAVLSQRGVSDVRIGVTPGQSEAVELLSSSESLDGLPRCSRSPQDAPSILNISGVARGAVGDPVSVAYQSIALLQGEGDALKEQLALIMIGPSDESGTLNISTSLALLDVLGGRRGGRVIGVGIAGVGQEGARPFDVQVGSQAGRNRFIALTDEQMSRAQGVEAIASHIQGRTVVAR